MISRSREKIFARQEKGNFPILRVGLQIGKDKSGRRFVEESEKAERSRDNYKAVQLLEESYHLRKVIMQHYIKSVVCNS